jgi:hypothetical protein
MTSGECRCGVKKAGGKSRIGGVKTAATGRQARVVMHATISAILMPKPGLGGRGERRAGRSCARPWGSRKWQTVRA